MTKTVRRAAVKALRPTLFGQEFRDYYARLLSNGRDCAVRVDEAHRDVLAQRHLMQHAFLSMGRWV